MSRLLELMQPFLIKQLGDGIAITDAGVDRIEVKLRKEPDRPQRRRIRLAFDHDVAAAVVGASRRNDSRIVDYAGAFVAATVAYKFQNWAGMALQEHLTIGASALEP